MDDNNNDDVSKAKSIDIVYQCCLENKEKRFRISTNDDNMDLVKSFLTLRNALEIVLMNQQQTTVEDEEENNNNNNDNNSIEIPLYNPNIQESMLNFIFYICSFLNENKMFIKSLNIDRAAPIPEYGKEMYSEDDIDFHHTYTFVKEFLQKRQSTTSSKIGEPNDDYHKFHNFTRQQEYLRMRSIIRSLFYQHQTYLYQMIKLVQFLNHEAFLRFVGEVIASELQNRNTLELQRILNISSTVSSLASTKEKIDYELTMKKFLALSRLYLSPNRLVE